MVGAVRFELTAPASRTQTHTEVTMRPRTITRLYVIGVLLICAGLVWFWSVDDRTWKDASWLMEGYKIDKPWQVP